MKRLFLLPLLLSLTSNLFAQSTDSLDSVFNAFISTFAKENVDWRRDSEFASDPHHIPAGRQLMLSREMGYFTFLPKTWDDFTPSERKAISKHAKYKAFLISMRNPNIYPSIGVGETLPTAPREDSNLFRNKPSYPVDGVPVPAAERLLQVHSDSPSGKPPSNDQIADIYGKTVSVQDTVKKAPVVLQILPEQLIQTEALRIQLF